MPYHHRAGFRIPRYLIVVIAVVISIGVGMAIGRLFATQKANGEYAKVVTTINQNIAGQIKRVATQSSLVRDITSAETKLDNAKTYKDSVAAVDGLRDAYEKFATPPTLECSDTSHHIATIDTTAVASSKFIPENIRRSLDSFKTLATSSDACAEVGELVASNHFSVFTRAASIHIKRINDTYFADQNAIKSLQSLLAQAPTSAETDILKREYGNDFANYISAYTEVVKSYVGLLTTKSRAESLLHSERIQTNSDKLEAVYDIAIEKFNTVRREDLRSSLSHVKDLYSHGHAMNQIDLPSKVDETALSGMIVLNAINTYSSEVKKHPTGKTLAELLVTLKAKKYIDTTSQFNGLGYTYDTSRSTYKLTVPTIDGDSVIEFTDKNAPQEAPSQTFTVQT